MKSWLPAALFVLAGVLPSWSAHAVDLTNEDSVAYRVIIVEEAGQWEVVVAPGETLFDICYRCSITLEDGETISAEPTDTITIQDGKLLMLMQLLLQPEELVDRLALDWFVPLDLFDHFQHTLPQT